MEDKKFKKVDFKIKAIEVSQDKKYAYVKGYGSVFGNVDQGDDIVENTAFNKTISDKKGKFPFLADHNPKIRETIGVLKAQVDNYGLLCDFEVNLEKEIGREFYATAKQFQENDMNLGLSIGYRIVKYKFDEKGICHLNELNLYEVSATPFPMNELATVTEVKELKEELLKLKSLFEKQPIKITEIKEADFIKLELKQIKEMLCLKS